MSTSLNDLPELITLADDDLIAVWDQSENKNKRVTRANLLSNAPGDLAVNGGDVTSTQTTFNLLNATVTTLNVGGAADINMSVAGKTTTIAGAVTIAQTLGVTGNTTLTGDLAVNGGDLTSTATTFNLLNTTVTTLNIGGAATTIALGAASAVITLADGANLAFNATTGTKIGTATTQKLSFYNATPIVQGLSVADASGGAIIDAEARTALNALISRIEATGLIATV